MIPHRRTATPSPAHLYDLEPRLEVSTIWSAARCASGRTRPPSLVGPRDERRRERPPSQHSPSVAGEHPASGTGPTRLFGEGQLHDPYAVPDIGVDGLVDHPGAGRAAQEPEDLVQQQWDTNATRRPRASVGVTVPDASNGAPPSRTGRFTTVGRGRRAARRRLRPRLASGARSRLSVLAADARPRAFLRVDQTDPSGPSCPSSRQRIGEGRCNDGWRSQQRRSPHW